MDRFERLATEYGLDPDKRNLKLSQGLRGTAYDVYAKLPPNKVTDYQALKEALLTRYELTAEAYRKKFRNARRGKGETYNQFTDRLDTYLQKC